MNADELQRFTGTETYHRLVDAGNVVVTDGAKYVADRAEAYWLVDAIARHQPRLCRHADHRLHVLQFWTLKVSADKSATLSCVADIGEGPAIVQRIPSVEFPLPELQLWVGRTDDYMVIYLPSEH